MKGGPSGRRPHPAKKRKGDGKQVWGPPQRTSSGRLSAGDPANDEWATTRRSWASLSPLLAHWKEARIWQPFYYDGTCAEHLRALGFTKVHHRRGEDFFDKVRDPAFLAGVDIIWDNPP